MERILFIGKKKIKVLNKRKQIKKYTDKVQIYETIEPDIVFNWNNREVAIEVETGKRHISRVEKKVKFLNKKYGEDWFFVVINWKDKEKYAKLGKTYVRKEVTAILKKNYFSQGSNSLATEPVTHDNTGFEVQNPCLNRGDISQEFEPRLEVIEPQTHKFNGG